MSVDPNAAYQLADVALPATGTIATSAVPVIGTRLSVLASWTGTPTGVLAAQCSFDGGAKWKTVGALTANFTANGNAQPAGGVGDALYDFPSMPGALWRLFYTATSGTGVLSVRYARESR